MNAFASLRDRLKEELKTSVANKAHSRNCIWMICSNPLKEYRYKINEMAQKQY